MDLTPLLTYASALIAVTVAPGPIMAVIITRALTRDIGGAVGFTAGVCLGDLIAIIAVSVGLGTWAANSPQWLQLFRIAGAAYMLWLAAQIWQSGYINLGPERAQRSWIGATAAGAAFSLCSPFTFVYYMMVLPSVIPHGINDPAALLMVVIVTFAAVGGILTVVMLLAHQFRRILSSPRASIAFSRGMAVLLVGTSVSLLTL